MAWTPPSQAEVEGSFAPYNNWGRWGKDDQGGTLHLITPAKRQAALALARRGRAVSLARDMVPHPNLDYFLFTAMPLRLVGSTGEIGRAHV